MLVVGLAYIATSVADLNDDALKDVATSVADLSTDLSADLSTDLSTDLLSTDLSTDASAHLDPAPAQTAAHIDVTAPVGALPLTPVTGAEAQQPQLRNGSELQLRNGSELQLL